MSAIGLQSHSHQPQPSLSGHASAASLPGTRRLASSRIAVLQSTTPGSASTAVAVATGSNGYGHGQPPPPPPAWLTHDNIVAEDGLLRSRSHSAAGREQGAAAATPSQHSQHSQHQQGCAGVSPASAVADNAQQQLSEKQQQQYGMALGASANSQQAPSVPMFGGGGNEDELRREVEMLRRSVALQDDKIQELSAQLQVTREAERRARVDAEVARAEAVQLAEEVRLERSARQQAEAAATEQQMAAEMAVQHAQEAAQAAQRAQSAQAAHVQQSNRKVPRSLEAEGAPAQYKNGSNVSGAGGHASRRPAGNSASPSPGRYRKDELLERDSSPAPPPNPSDRRAAAAAATDRLSVRGATRAGGAAAAEAAAAPDRLSVRAPGGNMSSRRGAEPLVPSTPHSAKDDIDARLHDFLDRNDCVLAFRRLNRGWYSFRHREDRGSPNDLCVEISIVNGKLMAKLEATTHDRGWNNGKLGPIERFVASYSG